MSTQALADRFWSKVEKSDGCWVWRGSRLASGYGMMWYGPLSRHHGAHRISWIMQNGPIPDGLFVLHRCDNPPCVRPDHLFLGTKRENAKDRDSKGRRIAPRGSRHGRAKLTEELVRSCRREASLGASINSLALGHGVTWETMRQALSGRTWSHVV